MGVINLVFATVWVTLSADPRATPSITTLSEHDDQIADFVDHGYLIGEPGFFSEIQNLPRRRSRLLRHANRVGRLGHVQRQGKLPDKVNLLERFSSLVNSASSPWTRRPYNLMFLLANSRYEAASLIVISNTPVSICSASSVPRSPPPPWSTGSSTTRDPFAHGQHLPAERKDLGT
jgi:hypothetical protein